MCINSNCTTARSALIATDIIIISCSTIVQQVNQDVLDSHVSLDQVIKRSYTQFDVFQLSQYQYHYLLAITQYTYYKIHCTYT